MGIQEKKYMRQDCKVKARAGTNYLLQRSSLTFNLIMTVSASQSRLSHQTSERFCNGLNTETLNTSDLNGQFIMSDLDNDKSM